MRLVIQRVHEASVTVGGEVVGKIANGLICFVGIARNDCRTDAEYVTRKCLKARLWPEKDEDVEDCAKTWHLSVVDKKFEVLIVSQFTLFGNLKKGNKPDFHYAMPPQDAALVFNEVVDLFKRGYDVNKIQTGSFGKYMSVDIKNDGPVTLFLDSRELYLPGAASIAGNEKLDVGIKT